MQLDLFDLAEAADRPPLRDFLADMHGARTADQARRIIRDHAAAINAEEIAIGRRPTVGYVEPKYCSRQYSTEKRFG